MAITKCETCNKIFHTEDYELQLLQKGFFYLSFKDLTYKTFRRLLSDYSNSINLTEQGA